MKALAFLVLSSLLVLHAATAEPVVDGTVNPGEYSHDQSLFGGKVVLSYQQDASGGLFIGMRAQAKGYVGIGLGTREMDGATIYFVFKDKEGNAVASEESGKGHGHTKSDTVTADQTAASARDDSITLEFHLSADRLPDEKDKISFIVAFSDSPDPTSWHGFFNKGRGTIDLK